MWLRALGLVVGAEHASQCRRVMRENGVKVLTVRDILSYAAEEHIGARVELENLAMRALRYELADGIRCPPAVTAAQCLHSRSVKTGQGAMAVLSVHGICVRSLHTGRLRTARP